MLTRERGKGNIRFPCSADHKQDWQHYPVDPYSALCCCFSHSAHWLPTRKKLFYTVANPARGLLNREKKMSGSAPPPPTLLVRRNDNHRYKYTQAICRQPGNSSSYFMQEYSYGCFPPKSVLLEIKPRLKRIALQITRPTLPLALEDNSCLCFFFNV